MKAISSGQNLHVADDAWLILREQGAIVEEADDDDDGFNEKDALAEKVGLHLSELGGGIQVVDLRHTDDVAAPKIASRDERISDGDAGGAFS